MENTEYRINNNYLGRYQYGNNVSEKGIYGIMLLLVFCEC